MGGAKEENMLVGGIISSVVSGMTVATAGQLL